MNTQDITVVTAVDAVYIDKLYWTYQTWLKFKPEIRDMKCLVIYDETQITPSHPLMQVLSRLSRGKMYFRGWTMHGAETQREKMLSSLVFMPAEHVDTKWYLKLDADTLANERKRWILDEWFQPNEKGEEPVFVASPWGYTKPGNLLDILDDWGDTVPALAEYPRLNIPHEPGSATVSSARMASWVMFGQTAWTKEAIKACPSRRLPVPSQDTFLYYVAARRKDYYYRARMGHHGWAHISKLKNLQCECERLLGSDSLSARCPLRST